MIDKMLWTFFGGEPAVPTMMLYRWVQYNPRPAGVAAGIILGILLCVALGKAAGRRG